tara:strand:+ start:247 stop:534 length:288 start_codon:yes stop_codon:yes gene_type:complete
MKNTLFAATVAVLASFGSIAPAQAQSEYAWTCTREYNSSVNLRTGPGRNYPVVASVPNGDYVRLLSWVYGTDNMKWYRVENSGLVGWSRQDYLCQ